MPHLYRPSIPLDVKLRVVLRQLNYRAEVIEQIVAVATASRRLGKMLKKYLTELSLVLNSPTLHLDHDPPLAARPQFRAGLSRTRYEPDANDPRFLIYRERHDHHIKTNVRGDGAQYRDQALIKRERKRRQGKSNHAGLAAILTKPCGHKRKKSGKWPSRKIQSRGFTRPLRPPRSPP